jgi:hypothetical protein
MIPRARCDAQRDDHSSHRLVWTMEAARDRGARKFVADRSMREHFV